MGSIGIRLTGCADLDRTENQAPFTIQVEGTGFSTDDFGDVSAVSCSLTITIFEQDDQQGQQIGGILNLDFQLTGLDEESDPLTPPNTPPVLSINGASSLTLAFGATYVELGASAVDNEDGDISANVQIGGDQVNTLIPSTYNVLYSVVDSGGLLATASRTVTVEPNEPPQITITGQTSVSIELDSVYVDAGATASDSSDVDLTDQIIVVSNVNTSQAGEYQVLYSVTDSAGAMTEAIRTVIVFVPDDASSAITAVLQSLTRVRGVSPETVYFSADQSQDIADSSLFHRYGRLAYHFNFDDPDSGNFATTGRSRNSQVGGSPRAIHTFVCTPESSRYDDGVCTYNVGVRVQNQAGDFDDDFITIEIESADNHYGVADTICVSSSGNFDGCNGQENRTTPPDIGDYSGMRVRFRRGDTFGDACIGYQESGALLDAFGDSDQRPLLRSVRVGLDTSCSDGVPTTARASGYPALTKNAAGHVTQGWAYDITVTGLRLGRARGGISTTLVTWHDLDLDWSNDPASLDSNFDGEFEMGNFGRACVTQSTLDCDVIPYPYGVFVTDTVVESYVDPNRSPPGNFSTSNLASVNINCFLECGLINSGVAGVDANTANEHNFRIQGAWGLVVSNVWFRGGHIAPGRRSRATIRNQETDFFGADLEGNPEDFSSGAQLRTLQSSERWSNRFNMILDSRFNQEEQPIDHTSASYIEFRSGHQYSGIYGNEFFTDTVSNGAQVRLGGVNVFARDNIYDSDAIDVACRFDNTFPEDTPYQDRDLIFGDTNDICNDNAPVIANPAAPGS